ncbi:hypothetical protein GKE82_13610 [Conexibacter sp. W3-3-2]|uniref:hypothetical protein n=1 Tax=Solirubrobacterales TaxID=588673 RepID=UPI0011B228A7|nr:MULTISPECIES: hypothetical protein [Solirubrobacterales]MTD45295.1 hypothetical protein [Conexibacter sp. W3-3-2]
MGRRSRKSGQAAPESVRRTPPPGLERAKPDMRAQYASRSAKSEARNAEVRAKLRPLAPDEHPRPLKFGIATCLVLAISNVTLALSGYELQNSDTDGANAYVGVTAFSIILVVAAVGMYKHKYWAILGFQALLALTVLIAGLSVVVASNVLALVLCLAVIAYGGWLFWSMIRVMARVQMPEARRPR